MIINSIGKYRKLFAWLCFLIFYSEFVAAALMRRHGTGFYAPKYSVGDRYIGWGANGGAVAAGERKIPDEKLAGHSKIPAAKRLGRTKKKMPIGGPGQPEMAAFQSVNANNLVDLFSGDFSYNIPLLDVGGYPIGLSYRSGARMDEEASWVGLGWNINPGTVSRNVRGLPDDFSGQEAITKTYNVRKNWTAGVTASGQPELFGLNVPKISASINMGVFYNNYAGIGLELGGGISVRPGTYMHTTNTLNEKGETVKVDSNYTTQNVGGSLSFAMNSQSGLNLDASLGVSYGKNAAKNNGTVSVSSSYNSRSGLQDLQVSQQLFNNTVVSQNQRFNNGSMGGSTSLVNLSFAKSTYTPTITMPFSHYSFSVGLRAGGAVLGFHPGAELRGNYSQQFIAPDDRKIQLPAYGYMYYTKANRNNFALLDFNREKDIPFRTQTPHTAIPVYTYDTYSITGEGIGGSFRPYRGDVGYMRDHLMQTKSGSGSTGFEIGAGQSVHWGGDFQINYATATQRAWTSANLMERRVQFNESDSTYEAVYFRNPGEQTTNSQAYFDKIGGDDVVSVAMAGSTTEPFTVQRFKKFDQQKFTGYVPVSGAIIKDKRDKRSQVISYLTANEAMQVGLDTIIKSYPINVFPKGKCDKSYEPIERIDAVRKPSHLSEITVLNGDGRRYVYGIPAYNLLQKEVSFAVDKSGGNVSTGLVTYTPDVDNTVNNTRGKDHFFNSEETPGYAHSFLLTGLLSPDYVDITGDGITEDDNGDAVKFNYSRMAWTLPTGLITNTYKWRAPYDANKAQYNPGMRSDKSDDRGNYVYGEKEIWFLNSIESKTMLATFVLDNEVRKDGNSVAGENGGRDANVGLKRLKEINLYNKSDYYKNPAKARPVKTVKFYYSYQLCVGSESSLTGYGKLTLDSLAFSYNGNKRSEKNRYRFSYHSNNPGYNNKSYDRWGNYKPDSDNPVSMPNSDFPYAVQDRAKADANAAAWNLSQITLPSGGKMQVSYEADDYGYVQHKRAMNMMRIVGMGADNNVANAKPFLYASQNGSVMDYPYVFVDVPSAVGSKEDIYQQYLEGVEKIHFRIQVQMPSDVYGSGYETVPFYSEYDDYGVTADSKKIWIKLRSFGKDQYPPAIAAIQYLRLNLPSKAYPGSDLDGESSFKALWQALLGMGKQFKDVVVGFNKSKRQQRACQVFDTDRSFLRLNNPYYMKLGGGHRVKKIVISDNWNAMTQQRESLYGQEYDYTTTKTIYYKDNGVQKSKVVTISSGVASYEPNIGNEENPWREPIEFEERVTLAPTDYLYSEYPYCETYFPGASVGYSKVRVSSINKKNLKSFNGWEETEFYTTKDFPVITDYTTFDGTSRIRGKSNFNFVMGRKLRRTSLSQGFKVELNDMNGKVKAQRSFAANDSLRPISYTANYYRTRVDDVHGTVLDNTMPVMDSATGKIRPDGVVGKDMELMMDFREHQTYSTNVTVQGNNEVLVFYIAVINIPAFFPRFKVDDNRFRSAVTLKVIQRYGILDSVVAYDKGSKISTRNMVYDGETGEVLLNRTQNEFNDPIYSFNYPAHWVYSGMGPAYKNIAAIFKGIDVDAGRIKDNYKFVEKHLESGDELYVVNEGSTNGAYCYTPTTHNKARTVKRLWVVDAAKATGGAVRDLYLMDRFGNAFTGMGATLKVLRSGKRNMGGASVGSITMLHDPIDKSNPAIWQLKLDTAVGVVAAVAGVYKDMWTVDNRFVSEQLCDTVYRTDSVSLVPTQTGLTRHYTNGGSNPPTLINGQLPLAASFYEGGSATGCNGNKPVRYISRAILAFGGLSSIPSHATINSASLRLLGMPPRNIWESPYSFCYYNAVTLSQSVAQYNINLGAGQTLNIIGNKTFLKRITQSWSGSTNFYEYDAYSTQNNAVTLDASTSGCQNYALDCKNLIQDYVHNPFSSYGFLLKLENESRNNYESPNTKDRNVSHMSFYPGSHLTSPQFYDCPPIKGYSEPPTLKVNYTYATVVCRDTCVSVFDRRINPYVQGVWGNWRMNQAYTFYDSRKDSVADANAVTDIRRNGTFVKFVPFWNFGSPYLATSNYDRWVWNAEALRYNKRGFETENVDPLGRYSSGVYGYEQSLPVAVAQNARYRQVAFDGFEDYDFRSDSCDRRCPPARHFDFSYYKGQIDTLQAHTGRASLKLTAGQYAQLSIAVVSKQQDSIPGAVTAAVKGPGCPGLDSFTVNTNILNPVFSPLQGDSMVLSAWVREGQDCKCHSYVNNQVQIVYTGPSGTIGSTVVLQPSGNIIEGWQRYEQVIAVPATATGMQLKLLNTSGNTNVYFDDIRLHPFYSNMKSFVYHATNLRLMAELDENNYASFYEYDDEGTLVRVKKETQRGVKTIQETRSVLLKQ
jgi:hypothetical protein